MEMYSECCGCPNDERFTYDSYWKLGVCANCKEHCEFEEVETNKKREVLNES